MAERMLTTDDNPYDPFTEWEAWDQYDRQMGYHTTACLARLVKDSHELPDAVRSQAIEDAIDDFLEVIVTGTEAKYKTVEATKTVESSAS
jgi:hypothetical protein